MIYLSSGIKNSLVVLEHLRNNSELNQLCEISVGAFTNCREVGFTFSVLGYNDDDGKLIPGSVDDLFTYCVYEHRNTDDIIINGKSGLINMNGDLPYKGGSKDDYIAAFSWHEHYKCAEKLADLILTSREKFMKSKTPKKALVK